MRAEPGFRLRAAGEGSEGKGRAVEADGDAGNKAHSQRGNDQRAGSDVLRGSAARKVTACGFCGCSIIRRKQQQTGRLAAGNFNDGAEQILRIAEVHPHTGMKFKCNDARLETFEVCKAQIQSADCCSFGWIHFSDVVKTEQPHCPAKNRNQN